MSHSTAEQVRALVVIGPILALLVLGAWLTLRSGVIELGSAQGLRRVAFNLSQAAVYLVACVAAMAFVQQLVGFHVALAW